MSSKPGAAAAAGAAAAGADGVGGGGDASKTRFQDPEYRSAAAKRVQERKARTDKLEKEAREKDARIAEKDARIAALEAAAADSDRLLQLERGALEDRARAWADARAHVDADLDGGEDEYLSLVLDEDVVFVPDIGGVRSFLNSVQFRRLEAAAIVHIQRVYDDGGRYASPGQDIVWALRCALAKQDPRVDRTLDAYEADTTTGKLFNELPTFVWGAAVSHEHPLKKYDVVLKNDTTCLIYLGRYGCVHMFCKTKPERDGTFGFSSLVFRFHGLSPALFANYFTAVTGSDAKLELPAGASRDTYFSRAFWESHENVSLINIKMRLGRGRYDMYVARVVAGFKQTRLASADIAENIRNFSDSVDTMQQAIAAIAAQQAQPVRVVPEVPWTQVVTSDWHNVFVRHRMELKTLQNSGDFYSAVGQRASAEWLEFLQNQFGSRQEVVAWRQASSDADSAALVRAMVNRATFLIVSKLHSSPPDVFVSRVVALLNKHIKASDFVSVTT